MCDFEDIDLDQVRPVRREREDQEGIEPGVQKDNPLEELGQEKSEAEEDIWFT